MEGGYRHSIYRNSKMEKEKLITFITSHQSFSDHPEIIEWINTAEENRGEYIHYKNLWAILQYGNDMSEARIKDGLVKVRKNQRRVKPRFRPLNIIKYAAFILVALFSGYLIGTVHFNDEIAMNEVFVPNGNRSSILLPDSTKVWISNGTKITYPEKFIGKNRIVELEGEGFFNVTHDAAHPFILKIGENRIQVLGTKFAVVAYPNDKLIKAELVSGQIRFDVKQNGQADKYQSYILTPSQSLVFDKSSGKVTESKISDNFYNYWVNGVYQFRDEAFEELAKKIERIYNVRVTFEDEELKKRLFSGSLSVNDNIFTLLKVFEHATKEPFIYTYKGNHIYIKKKY